MKLLESDFHYRRVGKINVLMSECIRTKTFKTLSKSSSKDDDQLQECDWNS
jgi:hypothetical protein